ncbi:GMC family oxidoreductase [Nibrella viscosa]|uniref:GMC family oxidoreductase n=1 Tax=Nibrella viscosa TaxID=1084524 RepID=A0ABP8L3Q5_9BACT
MNLNIKAQQANTYDAIVVGSGISGGWAAKELTQKGLKVLLLDRGEDIEHVSGYKTAMTNPWEFPHRGRPTTQVAEEQAVQARTGYTISESSSYLFVNDKDNPYLEDKRFDWMRGYHKGGRSLMWGRQVYRWSDLDFEANAKEGIAIDWPIRYKDIQPWYDYVERFIGVSGNKENLPHLPDSLYQPAMDMYCLEKHIKGAVEKKWPERRWTIGRVAHLTKPTAEQTALGRASCQYRNLCIRGCPYGAYFSSQAATLPVAQKTGRLTFRPYSFVTSLIYDEKKQKATGVRVIDEQTSQELTFNARIIFLCASSMASTYIMLNSTSNRFPNGLGNDSGELGHNVMDHHFRVGASGEYEGFDDQYYYGRRANGVYVPRYRNLPGQQKRDYLRGFGYQGSASRMNWGRGYGLEGFGADFKEQLTKPGPWTMGLTGFGECLPYHENKVVLDHSKKDKWGQPVLRFDADFKDNEMRMRKDMGNDAAEMLEAAGLKNVRINDAGSWPGLGIHEMGTARMGNDPKTSVLNKFNQVHSVKNVFNTDGACMTSANCVNPSLTYMALTARAANYAVQEMKKQNL